MNESDEKVPPPDPNEEDLRLMKLIGEGDENALRMLVHKWQGPIINYFFRSLHSVQTSEDLAQIVFIRIYRNAATYRPQARFSTYIFHIARNILINEFRRMHRKPAELYDPTDFTPEISSEDTVTRNCAEIEEAFAKAIADLPENQRTALLLLKQQEISYEEIATIMDATVPLVKTWIFRARQHLRESLKEFL